MSNINRRVVVTQSGKNKGVKGTVVAENKFSWQVKVDGSKNKGTWLRSPKMSDAECKLVRGRRPKANVAAKVVAVKAMKK